MNELLTTKQVAEIFNVDVRTVLYNFIPKGLKYFKVGNKDYRFTQKAINEFIESQTFEREHTQFIDTRTEYQKKMNKKRIIV